LKRILYIFLLLGHSLILAQTETFVLSLGGQVSDAVIDNIGQTVTASSLSSGITLSEGFLYNLNFTAPTVILTDTDSDNIVTNSNVVTITATFSESMSVTPTLSLSGIISNAQMSATTSASVWTYAWTVSTTVTSTTATVSGTDLAGNAYSGTEAIVFTIDNEAPEINFSAPVGFIYLGYFDAHLYFINSGTTYGSKKNWQNARVSAATMLTDFTLSTTKARGGLVSIDSSGENEFIGAYFDSSYSKNTAWIGVYQESDNSSWKNRLGNTQTFFSWRSDQPSGTNQHAIQFIGDPTESTGAFSSESNVWTDEDASNLNDYIVEIDNFYFEDNANSTKISFYATMETLTWSLSGEDAIFFEIDDSDNQGAAQSIFIDFKSNHIGALSHTNPQDANSDNIYSVVLSVSDAQSNTTSVVLNFEALDSSAPTVTLTDTDSDNLVSNSDVVTITATFSESMSATPTLNLSGIISDAPMSATSSDSVWTYTWTVSTSVSSTTANVSGTDLSGNVYSGTESITFKIDNIAPTVSLTDTDSDNLVSNLDVVTITATFSESMTATPTLSLSGITSNAQMSATTSDTVWTYAWTVSTTVTSSTATVSGTDLAGNTYSGTNSITFIIDNTNPTVSLSSSDNDNIVSAQTSVTITATFSEAMSVTPTISITGIGSNLNMSIGGNNKIWTYTLSPTSSISSTTATVSGTDLIGNQYSGSDSLTITIDNSLYQISTSSISQNNLNISLTFSEEVFTDLLNGYGVNGLTVSDFSISQSGGSGSVLTSLNPSSISKSGNTYNLSIPLSGYATGTETITISIAENNIYDIAGNSTALSKDFSLNNNLLIEYDITNTNSYNGQPTSNSNKIVNDLSGYGYDGEIIGTSDVYFDSNENALFFNGNQEKDGKGLAISGLNYVSGDSDNIEELTIFARIKVPTTIISRNGNDDQRIIFSFDRSSVFRFSIGSDFNQSAKGKLAFHFTNSDGTFDTHAENTDDLRDNQWHNVVVTFKANQAEGLKYYIDGNLVYAHSGSFASISNQSDNETPRFGYVGNGNESSSFKGNTGPDDLFYGYIQKIKYYNKVLSASQLNGLDTNSPTVTLTDNMVNKNVNGSDTVRIISTFNEVMSSSPKISISGQVSNSTMTASSTSVWYYDWDVPSSFNGQVTATVTGTDLAGNGYSGSESITYKIDNLNPTLVSFTDNITDNYVNNNNDISLLAIFSESMASTPTLSISGLVTDTSMTVSASTNSTTWTYLWDVPSGSDGIYFATVSGTDLSGNLVIGTDSLTYVIDNTAPLLQSVNITDANSKILLSYNEPIQLYDPSYLTSNFSVTKSGGAATVSYTGYSFSSTESNTIILNITVTGEPTGDELIEVGPAGASTLIDRAGNYALDYSDSSQTSNTVYLTNTPPKFASTSVNSSNTSITITFSEEVYGDQGKTPIENTDFILSVSGGTAVLSSSTPIALSTIDSKTFILSTSYTTSANGTEILTVTPVSNSITASTFWNPVFDSKGTQIDLTQTQSNTVQLNDQAGPSITGTAIDSQSRYVDITFSEGVYATASPATAVTSSSFTLSQRSGPSYGMTISNITTAAGGALSGGETTLRFNLGSAVKPTGQEVFAITATDSSSVVDASGNSMNVSQTKNTFQLKPPTSGGVSPEKSTISAAPAQMIGNGINTAVITVQAKDSLGQNFLEGGYQITLFGPDGDLTTTDNQNGTYSASYTPDAITQDFQELTFGFRVANTNGTLTAILRLYLDEDADGIYNINDQCLGTEAGLEVDATGCALNQLDSDNDGVFDDLDECPDTPEFEINNIQGTPTYGELIPTVVDEKGCGASQRDTDGDGIVDTEDNCIETANADQADADGDGIGDVCDTDNPLPEITTTEIKFVQLPQNGTTVGKIEATDPDGETLTFTQSGDNFTGVLSIASDGSITVSSGALLTFDSAYNGASLGFTVSDGENDVPGSVKILIEDVPRPPEISIITLEISEDAEIGTIVGFVEAIDPMGGQIVSISLQGDGFIELVDGVLKTTQELDYETTISHPFSITAQASDRSDGPGLSGSKSESVRVADIPNATYTGRFFISIFNVEDETLGAKVDHTRYFNPHNKNVGKWKVKKKIKGGADADKFTIKSRSKTEQKNGNPVEEETEDYLDFITPPDFENPGDANKDNIYEVEIEYINTDDGEPEVPIVVTQTNIQVPEGKSRTIELQAQPVLPTDDNDGDGVVDILDNSPLVANPDQSDEDGDGVGDVTDDFDHDGVWNPFDTCPDTPLGELVDLDGCLIYYLPASNFSIFKTEKCIGENSITIDVIDATVDYNVTVSGATNATEVFTGSSWSLENLSAGEYTLCIGVEGVNPSEFERCFEVTIEESDPLLVSSLHSKENQTVTFDLSGGSAYQITHNGKTIQTSSSKHTVQLDKGINNISISTGIECQGLFQNSYLNSYEVKYAPNPFKEQLQFFIGGKDNLVEIGVYSSNGQLIDYQTVSLSFGMRNYSLNTSSYKQGVFIIKVKGQTLDQSIQVIKE